MSFILFLALLLILFLPILFPELYELEWKREHNPYLGKKGNDVDDNAINASSLSLGQHRKKKFLKAGIGGILRSLDIVYVVFFVGHH